MPNIKADLQIFDAIKQRIAAAFELEPDDEAVIDTASGECDLEKTIAHLIRESRVAEAQAKGVAMLIDEMKARALRLKAKHDKLRDIAAWAMTESGLRKSTAPDFTFSLGHRKSPVVTTREPTTDDIVNNPDEIRIKTTLSWDRDAVRAALETGGTLDFAYIANPEPVLTVRAK